MSNTIVLVVEDYIIDQPIDKDIENVKFLSNQTENAIVITANNEKNEKGLYDSQVFIKGNYEALARMYVSLGKHLHDTFMETKEKDKE